MSVFKALRDYRIDAKAAAKAAKAKAKEEAREQSKMIREATAQVREDIKSKQKADRNTKVAVAKEARKADVTAAKVADRDSKRATKQAKADRKLEAKLAKAHAKQQDRRAEQILEAQKERKLQVSDVTRWVGIARIAVPVLLPLLYRGTTMLRERMMESSARRQGVTASQLAQHSGHGAPLLARIDGARMAAEQVKSAGFQKDAKERLDALAAAVRSADHMLPGQRRRVHDSVSSDLAGIDNEIVEQLKR
ncbi:DUF6474 family protein [Corynebacterium ulceribovis]|uniref:DUF6474 family protein n=1 Tax=Corynebacterium ulceribovis TaxID=487732 RepID=UPI00035F59D6|nr:DUF6474 family protein [Corynebacterium ulceribovis]